MTKVWLCPQSQVLPETQRQEQMKKKIIQVKSPTLLLGNFIYFSHFPDKILDKKQFSGC